MRIQGELQLRSVSLANLEAMCARVSSTCHRYKVEKITDRFCYVSYSNPDEYGCESPMMAIFPTIKVGHDGDDPFIVLHFHAIRKDTWHGEGWQAFQVLLDCPHLWRDADQTTWRSEKDIADEKRNFLKTQGA